MRRSPFLVVAAVVFLSLVAHVGGAEVAPPRQISVDPFEGGGQHETAVEPDSIAFGGRVVSVFQVGRIVEGGASGIGWATSSDGGSIWSSGVLPGLTTTQSPPGLASRVSDPVVAYDRAHSVWLASVLALRDPATQPSTSLLVSRSADGLSWGGPITTAPDEGRPAHDKNWIACDNGAASRFAGTCYVAWTGHSARLTVSRSTDGGLTWSAPTIAADSGGTGFLPLVRPDGTLVVVFTTSSAIHAVRSLDGGRTFSPARFVTSVLASPVPGMRAPALPSAEVDRAGRLVVAWQDCRFRRGCGDAAPNDLVWVSSTDGVRWTPARRIPTGRTLDGAHHFVPGLGVDATTSGAGTRVAVAFNVLTPRGCTPETCLVQAYVVTTATAGRTWSDPAALGAPAPLGAFPQSTGGRFLGDYISTSFVPGGVAVPVFATAAPPADGRFRQGVYATRVPPLGSRGRVVQLGTARVVPLRPSPRGRVVVSAPLTLRTSGHIEVDCRAAGRRVGLVLVRDAVVRGRASCTWLVRSGPRGVRVTGAIVATSPETEATRTFSFRLR